MVILPLGDYLMKSLEITPSQFGFAVSAYAFSAPFTLIAILGGFLVLFIWIFLEPINQHLDGRGRINKKIGHHYRDILYQPNYQYGFLATA